MTGLRVFRGGESADSASWGPATARNRLGNPDTANYGDKTTRPTLIIK